MKQINRMNDYFVKYLLGTEKNKHISLNFINAVLANKDHYFTDVIFTNKDDEPVVLDGKEIRLDIKGKLNTGTIIDIEVQVRALKYMGERSLYYWARMYSRQISEGEDYNKLKPAIAINLLDYNLLPEGNWLNQYSILNTQSHTVLSDHFNIIFIEPLKLDSKALDEMTPLELWGAFFKRRVGDDKLKEVPIMAEALKAEMQFTASEIEDYKYEMREKALKDKAAMLSYAKEEGKAEGRIEGRIEGKAEGENKMAQLMTLLFKEKRYEDAEKAATDPVYRAQLLQELLPEN